MRFAIRIVACGITVLLLGTAVRAQWQQVSPGIEYQKFTLPDPNNVFVSRMDRNNLGVTIESSVANGTIIGARETVRNQAARYEDTINWWGQSWGQRNDVVVAINGDFFNPTTGVITGGQCYSGWYARQFTNWGGYSGFGWTVNRIPFIGGCVYHQPSQQIVAYPATGNSQQFKGINRERGTNELVIYTPQYDTNTHTDNTGSEVLVEVSRPTVIINAPNKTVGYVRQIRQNLGSTLIPFDHIVLSATGSAATTLLNNVSLGAEVHISQTVTDYNEPDTNGQNGCAYATGLDWQKTYAAVGVNYRFLEAGVVRPPDPSHSGYAGLIVRNPRTAVAYNGNYVFFIVCDGRSANSVGMTMTELGNFCVNYLGATDGANLDGGGSSTMVVNGVVKNTPSDGSERAVANGMMMVALQPKIQSSAFAAGQLVKTRYSTSMRLGPGTNYGAIQTIPASASLSILSHAIQGIYAKGAFWWKCQYGTTSGWVDEAALTFNATRITAISPTLGSMTKLIVGDPVDVAVTFGQPVSVAAGHLTLTSPRWGPQAPTTFSYDAPSKTATWRFIGLKPETWTATVSDAVVDVNGFPIDGEIADPTNPASLPSGNGQPGGAAVFQFGVRTIYGDFDLDGDVDLADFARFQACFSGPNVPAAPGCADVNADGPPYGSDNDVDLSDFAAFQVCFSGPNNRPNLGCSQ